MERQIFLDSLRRALYGKISDAQLEEHIQYYETYLAQEAAKGRQESEILEELGDPRLLAKSITETSGGRHTVRGLGPAAGLLLSLEPYPPPFEGMSPLFSPPEAGPYIESPTGSL